MTVLVSLLSLPLSGKSSKQWSALAAAAASKSLVAVVADVVAMMMMMVVNGASVRHDRAAAVRNQSTTRDDDDDDLLVDGPIERERERTEKTHLLLLVFFIFCPWRLDERSVLLSQLR